jgi:hypothetical protein
MDMTKNRHQTKETLEKSALNGMACCYDHESTRTIENGATVKEDTSIEVCNITKRASYMLDSFI